MSIQLRYNGLDFSANNIADKRLHIKMAGLKGSKTERVRIYDEKEVIGFHVKTDKDGNRIITVEANLPFDKAYFEVSNPYYYSELSMYFSDSGQEDSYVFLIKI